MREICILFVAYVIFPDTRKVFVVVWKFLLNKEYVCLSAKIPQSHSLVVRRTLLFHWSHYSSLFRIDCRQIIFGLCSLDGSKARTFTVASEISFNLDGQTLEGRQNKIEFCVGNDRTFPFGNFGKQRVDIFIGVTVTVTSFGNLRTHFCDAIFFTLWWRRGCVMFDKNFFQFCFEETYFIRRICFRRRVVWRRLWLPFVRMEFVRMFFLELN